MAAKGVLFYLLIGLIGAVIGAVLAILILQACLVCPPAEPPPGGGDPGDDQLLSLVPSNTPPVACDAAHEGAMYVWVDSADTNPLYEALLCMCRKDEASAPATYSWQHPTKIGGSCP